MPSPFPGMDPFLEGSLWISVRTQLNAEIARHLAPKLRPRYLALTTERFVSREPESAVEIRDTANRQLVTAIEVLSPTNKRGEGREEYLPRRRRILLSSSHLIEIDLLRKGDRVPMLDPLPLAPYFVLVSRAEKRPITDVWPILLEESLPVVPVPLLPEDADIDLDLQEALTNVYDIVGYDLAVNYNEPPEVPLDNPALARWVAERGRGSK